MSVSLRQVRAFVSVAHLGSFTRAAHLLHLSQPALTVQIRRLEEALGVRLFDRNTRAVQLTRVGRELAPVFQRLLREFDAVVVDTRELAAKKHGIVRLAALPTVASGVLPEIIAEFRTRHPRVSFVVRDAIGRRIVAMIKAEEVDFGIGGGGIVDPELEAVPLMEDRLHVVYPASHPIDAVAEVSLDVLASYPLVLTDPETSVRSMVDAAFVAAGRLPLPACETTYMSTAVGMVRAGLGVAILPSTAMELRAEPSLRSRPIDEPGFVRPIVVLKKPRRSLPPPAESFFRMLTTTLRGQNSNLKANT